MRSINWNMETHGPCTWTLMMTSAQVVETSVNVTSKSVSQDYTHQDDHNLPNYDMTPGFKPFTVIEVYGPISKGPKLNYGYQTLRTNQ